MTFQGKKLSDISCGYEKCSRDPALSGVCKVLFALLFFFCFFWEWASTEFELELKEFNSASYRFTTSGKNENC